MERYCREIILDHVSLFRGDISADILFMGGNARPHRNAEVSNILESEDIKCMQWLAYSLHLNPILHVCYALCRRVSQITRPPRTVQELKIALKEG